MPEDEMRVTVIATGLDHDRVRHTRGRESHSETEIGNVTPLRRESTPTAPSPLAAERLTVPERLPAPDLGERRESRVAPQPPISALDGNEELMSPYAEDEYDVPTFIRRGASGDPEDDEEPAFLRRSAD